MTTIDQALLDLRTAYNAASDERLKDLQAKADTLHAGIVWSKDAAGNYSVTNIPQISPQQQQAADPAKHLEEEMRRIYSITDPKEKFLELTKFGGSVQTMLADYKQAAAKQAESELKVEALRNTLAANELADRNSKNYNLYKSDSKITAGVRRQYEAALAASTLRAEAIFQNNPIAQKIAGITKPFLAEQMNVLQRQENKVAEQEAKNAALEDQFGTGHLELASAIAPNGNPVQVAAKEYKNVQFREAAMLINRPEELVPVALIGNNTYAKTGLLYKQAEALSGTTDKTSAPFKEAMDIAAKDFREMTKIVNNDNVFLENFKVLYPNAKKRDTLLAQYELLGHTTDGEKQRKTFRASYAPIMLESAKRQAFLANVNSWKDALSLKNPNFIISKAYDIVQKRLGGDAPMSLSALAAGIHELPKREQAQAQEELIAIASSSKNKIARGYYGNFGDSLDIRNIIITNITDAYLNATAPASINPIFPEYSGNFQ